MRSRRLVSAYGSIYSMTTRQWLKYCHVLAKGLDSEVPGRYLGEATSVTDWSRLDASCALDVLCQNCGAEFPSELVWAKARPSAHPRYRTADEAAAANDKCLSCGAHVAHSLRAAEVRRKKRNA